MRRTTMLALAATGVLALSYLATAAPPARRAATPPVISSHQIDRFDAITKTKARLNQEPKSLADWVILGELAQEAAMNLPEAQAAEYLKMSRDAYEKALALAPHNAGIKAAVQFARDMEANLDQFERSRDQATEAYLAARRRDLALANYTPAIAVYQRRPAAAAPVAAVVTAPDTGPVVGAAPEPAPAPAARVNPAVGEEVVTNPPLPNDPTTDNATFGARLYYGALPTYRSFVGLNGESPLTYKEYSSAYYPPGVYTDPVIPPVTPPRMGLLGLPAVNDSPVVTPPVRPK